MTMEQDIIIAADDIMKKRGYVTTREVYTALPNTPPLNLHHLKREPSLYKIARVLVKNGYHPVGNTRGGHTHYKKGE